MKRLLLIALFITTFSVAAQTPAPSETATPVFDRWFENKSLRIDFALTGNAERQSAAVERLREEPVWGGPKKNLIDNFGYGDYFVKVFDAQTDRLIYSRGFNTLFSEWRTTEQALAETQSWLNTVVVPYPKNAVRIEITGAEKSGMPHHTLMSYGLEPSSYFIDRSPMVSHPVYKIKYEGDPAEKLDLVFLAEGYTAEEAGKFQKDVERFSELLFQIPPYANHRDDINIWGVAIPSGQSGTDVAGEGIYVNTALNSGFYTFGIDRYLTTPDMRAIRDAVWDVPCDAIFVLVNSERYGGGGIYNFYAIGTADNERTTYVFVHELGHSLAGLADEYFEKSVTYEGFYDLAYEPWEPNITTLVDFGSKWKAMLPEGTPIPTVPGAAAIQRGKSSGSSGHSAAQQLGVYEGGGYVSKGIYRPVDHCMMRDYHPFCPVCSKAITRMIDYFCDREY